MDRYTDECERENALWRSSIIRMFQSEDLEELIDLAEGPEVLDDSVADFLNCKIQELKNKMQIKDR